MNEFPSYFVTLHNSVSSYFSQISVSDLYFFLCPFCTTLHRVLSSFSYFSIIKNCGFDRFYLDADDLLVCNSGPIPFHITRWTFACPVGQTHQQVLPAPLNQYVRKDIYFLLRTIYNPSFHDGDIIFWDMQLKSKAKVILSLWSSPLYFLSFYVVSVTRPYWFSSSFYVRLLLQLPLHCLKLYSHFPDHHGCLLFVLRATPHTQPNTFIKTWFESDHSLVQNLAITYSTKNTIFLAW